MKNLLQAAGATGVEVESAAMHTDEIGSDIHPGTRRMLVKYGIPFAPRQAWLLTSAKAREYDLIVGMDAYNLSDLKRRLDPGDWPKAHLLLEFAGLDRDVADPWYTGDFETTYADILLGCRALVANPCFFVQNMV